MPRRHPDWIKVKPPGNPNYLRLKRILREKNLHTVCEEARCPNHFAKTVFWIKSLNPGIRVELLIPDFEGNLQALETVVNSGIEILNHNIETVPRLYGKVRPGHSYECSLGI